MRVGCINVWTRAQHFLALLCRRALLFVAAAAVSVEAVERANFKTCDQSGFCKYVSGA